MVRLGNRRWSDSDIDAVRVRGLSVHCVYTKTELIESKPIENRSNKQRFDIQHNHR